ncbi:hypothetical protein JCM10207_003246 [Rhodosporidiobolus poonsookiae]
MDHGGMDHGGHGGMDHDMPGHGDSMPCKMAMVWNTDPVGACLVFPQLQITSQASLVFWLAFIIAISLSCEYLRLSLLTFDRALRSSLRGGAAAALAHDGHRPTSRAGTPSGMRRPSGFQSDGNSSEEALLGAATSGRSVGGRYWGVVRLPFFVQIKRSLGYAAYYALTSYVMLLLMSYNAQIIGAIILGAFLGHLIFQRNLDLGAAEDGDVKGGACH